MRGAEAVPPLPDAGPRPVYLDANLDASPSASVLVDLEGRVTGWSATAEQMLEVCAAEAVGRPFNELDPSYRLPGLQAAVEELRRRPDRRALPAVTFARRDGSLATARVTLAPVVDTASRVAGLLVSLEDCAELDSLRAERDGLAAELQARAVAHEDDSRELARHADEVAMANEELRVLNEQLQSKVSELETAQQADRKKSEFLAILAHELRNPLAPILTAMYVVRARTASDPLLEQARRTVERQVKHLARLLDDLLDVSRISQDKIELRRAPVDLAGAMAEAVEGAAHMIQAAGHELQVAFSPEPLIVEGDATRLVQVLGNLLNNAAKYTEPGGRITVTGTREGEEAVVRVRDTGIGITPELLPRVFDLFTQADSSLARSRGGLGIGLTLVRMLVELHGGRVSASSRGRGHGSEFVVRLPLVQAAPVSSPPSPLCPSAARRVLIIEDNRDAREMLRIALEMEGHSVHAASTGPQGVEAARALAPDVILLDVGLPGLDGYEAARRIRRGLGGAVVLVAVTGYGDPEAKQRAVEAGFDVHLVKPVDPVELTRIVAGGGPRPRGGASRPKPPAAG
jgi:PAS domain S-box-containing protein